MTGRRIQLLFIPLLLAACGPNNVTVCVVDNEFLVERASTELCESHVELSSQGDVFLTEPVDMTCEGDNPVRVDINGNTLEENFYFSSVVPHKLVVFSIMDEQTLKFEGVETIDGGRAIGEIEATEFPSCFP